MTQRSDPLESYERLDPLEPRGSRNPMSGHVTAVAVLHFVMASGLVLAALIVAVAVGGGGLLSGDLQAIATTSVVAAAVSGLLLLLAVPGLLTGWGLLRHYRWARVLALVLAAFHLPGFPFGSAFGVYSFWVLLSRDASDLFDWEWVDD